MLVPGILLVGLFMFSVFFLEGALDEEFLLERERASRLSAKEMAQLLQSSNDQLVELGELIPHLAGLHQPLLIGDAKQLTASFESHWPMLELGQRIELIQFFDLSGRSLGRWGEPALWRELDAELPTWVAETHRAEKPLIRLSCHEHCFQITVSPILVDGRHKGAMLLARSLAETLSESRLLAEKDIGLLTEVSDKQQVDPRWDLSAWGLHISALTHYRDRADVLQAAARAHPQKPEVPMLMRVTLTGAHFEIQLLPLGGVGGARHYLALIEDISTAVTGRRSLLQRFDLVVIPGLIVVALILAFLLFGLIMRLEKVANIFPLLTKGRFADAREQLTLVGRGTLMIDEIDLLQDIASSLMTQMETQSTTLHRIGLERDMQQAEQEQQENLAQQLLGDARLVLLSRDAKGLVTGVHVLREGHWITTDGALDSIQAEELLSRLLFQDGPDSENL